MAFYCRNYHGVDFRLFPGLRINLTQNRNPRYRTWNIQFLPVDSNEEFGPLVGYLHGIREEETMKRQTMSTCDGNNNTSP
jgi:hypothetical protein